MIQKFIEFIKESNQSELKEWAYEYAKQNHDGFNSYEDAKDELDYFFKYEYPDMKDEFFLYRVIQSESESNIDMDHLGDHYITSDEITRLKDKGFYDSIGMQFDPDMKLFLVKVLVKNSLVDWQETLHNRLNFPREYEITLKSNPEIIDIKEIEKPEF